MLPGLQSSPNLYWPGHWGILTLDGNIRTPARASYSTYCWQLSVTAEGKWNIENMWLLENGQCIFHSGPDKCCKVQARESPSGCAHNERQDDLNTTPSCHRRRSSGTWMEGSDRLSRVEITLALIGWLGAAGAQISRFQEVSGLVKWTGTVCALCACVSVCLACVVHLLLHACVPTGTDHSVRECVCVRVLKNCGLICKKGRRPNWSSRESKHESRFSNFYILLAETYMLWQWQVTGHVTGTAVNSQTAELWWWSPVCSCNYCTCRLIHKPITHLRPSPQGRYNVLHFIAGWNKGNKNQKSVNEALRIIKLNVVR